MAKVRVERGNVVLRVEEYELQHYLQLGYNRTDEDGNVLNRSIPQDLGELQKAYVENGEKIATLEATVAQLTAELDAIKRTNATPETTERKRTRKTAQA